jgi:thioredoxin reductase (NADPH)
LTLSDGTTIESHAVLIATGVSYRRLEAPGVQQLTGAGVYYGAAMVEADSCANEPVFIVGGANSAGQAAMYFARFARHVTILYRGADLRKSMSSYLIDQIAGTPTITVETGAQVTALHGDDHLEAITVAGRDGERRVDAQGVFVFIGASPRTDWVGGAIARDRRGFILSGPDVLGPEADGVRWPLDRDPYLLETSLPGVFVAGDVRHQSIKRVASAVGDGSMSVQFVHQYLGDLP